MLIKSEQLSVVSLIKNVMLKYLFWASYILRLCAQTCTPNRHALHIHCRSFEVKLPNFYSLGCDFWLQIIHCLTVVYRPKTLVWRCPLSSFEVSRFRKLTKFLYWPRERAAEEPKNTELAVSPDGN